MNSNKIAFFAAAASLTFAGAAFAQSATSMTTPGQQVPPAASPSATTSPPMTTTTPPAMDGSMDAAGSSSTSAMPAQPSADTSAAPTSATVATDFKVGAEIRDPAGISIGTVSGASTAADGSVNVVVTNGAVKFALPSASLSSNAGVLTTTATKAQIDATLAGAKPQ